MSAHRWLGLLYGALLLAGALAPPRRPWQSLLAGGGLAGVALAAHVLRLDFLAGCAGVVAGVMVIVSCRKIREGGRRDRP